MTLERITINKNPKNPGVIIQEHLMRYIFAIKYVQNKDVLDVAIGSGYGSAMMAKIAKYVAGFDYSQKALKKAAKEFINLPSFNFYLSKKDLEIDGDLAGLDNNKNVIDKYDVCTCFETLEHLSNPEFLLLNIKLHMKPDGVVFISTPNCPTQKDNNEWHKQAFNFETLTNLAKSILKPQELKIYSQNQWGLSKTLNREYLFLICHL